MLIGEQGSERFNAGVYSFFSLSPFLPFSSQFWPRNVLEEKERGEGGLKFRGLRNIFFPADNKARRKFPLLGEE